MPVGGLRDLAAALDVALMTNGAGSAADLPHLGSSRRRDWRTTVVLLQPLGFDLTENGFLDWPIEVRSTTLRLAGQSLGDTQAADKSR